MNKTSYFEATVILVLTFLFFLLLGVSFEKDREKSLEVYKLENELRVAEDMLEKATMHIELLHDQLEVAE